MSTNPRSTLSDLTRDIDTGLDRLYSDAKTELSRSTPRDTGNAARSWSVGNRSSVGRGGSATVITNDANYINVLNTGHSSQAPAGFVERTLERVVRSFRN